MRNRGNGKGGGIAVCGLVPREMGVSKDILENDYILQIALLNPDSKEEIEKECIEPYFNIDQGGLISTVSDYRDIPLLAVKPPDIARYFVRVKSSVLEKFRDEQNLSSLSETEIEDEFVFQNSIRINKKFYSSIGEKKAFVISHAKNLIILKIVGYAEAVVQYYCMEDTHAHVWIAHQRYPTKGKVWHPGGAHPFIGMNEALVHNGDFANYHSVSEFLAQRNLFPLFLTDTEVSVMLFDLMNRVYKYPIEYIIEALAPTTELDFDRLPEKKQKIYREIQAIHTHASPDGPWFFIIARNLVKEKAFQLLGITDTAMLRPQVFALQEGEVSVGLVCSEKQAIDATLDSLAKEDPRITPIADMYWNARGGSYTDGGAFMMTLNPKESCKIKNSENNEYELLVNNKFGDVIRTSKDQTHFNFAIEPKIPSNIDLNIKETVLKEYERDNNSIGLYKYVSSSLLTHDYNWVIWFADMLVDHTKEDNPGFGIDTLTYLIDMRYSTGMKKRSSLICIFRNALEDIFKAQPLINENRDKTFARITWDTRDELREPTNNEKTLLIDCCGFTPEGETCDGRLAVCSYKLGWKHMIHYNTRGTRFHAAGFGPSTADLRVDCYDNPGDYLGSGMDGLSAYVHGNAQDQLSQISKKGKLVIYGDVGQTFLYGAKGGEFYVMGNVAGRPMINAVGKPRVVINGTALDFLAESFMAGIPTEGGGFAIVNGVKFNDKGEVVPLELPYPGSNLLSLASGGAIYIRDPDNTLSPEQLNGGVFRELTISDWKLILPYLEENERLFNIKIDSDLLTVDGVVQNPSKVYKKVIPEKNAEIEEELEGIGD